MYLSLSSVLAKMVFFVMSLLVFYSPLDNIKALLKSGDDSSSTAVSADTTKVERPSKKVLKISISDRGIKVKSDKEGNIVLEVESDKEGKVKGIKSTVAIENIKENYYEKGSDIVRLGKDIFIDRNEIIRGSAVAFGSDIVIRGKVFGDVVAISGDVELDSTSVVNGDVVTVFGDLERHEGSVVRGEIAEVGGANITPFSIGSFRHPGKHSFGFGLLRAGGRVVLFVVFALLMLLILYLLSDRMKRASAVASRSFLKSLGVGFVVAFAGSIFVVILAIIIGITIIGIPISILILFSFAALVVIGQYVGALALGEFISKRFGFAESSIYIKALVGLFLIFIFSLVAGFLYMSPFLAVPRVLLEIFGKVFVAVSTMVGLGAFVISKFGSPGLKPKMPIE